MAHECKYYNRDGEGILRCVECGKPSTKIDASGSYQRKMDKAEIEDKAIHKIEDKAVKKTKKKKR